MNITHVCLCGLITEGFSYQENMLVKYHTLLGHKVSVITSQWIRSKNRTEKIDKTDYIGEYGARYIRLPLSGHHKISDKFKKYVGVIDAIKKTNPDVLFIHNLQFVDIKQVANYLKDHPTKVYVDSHTDFSNSSTNLLSYMILHRIIWKHYGKVIEPYVTRFYGVLPARVDFLKNVYSLPPDKCSLLVMGADDELVRFAKDKTQTENVRKEHNIQQNDFLIATGGKIDIAKKQTLLLMQAVKNISVPNLKLLVFGSVDNELKQEFDSLCDGDKIQYLGWFNSPSAYRVFGASDLVVFPGRHSVYWEQVAGQGIPMVVKKWAGTQHVDCRGNVLFLEKDSVEEIQSVIERLLNNPQEYDCMKKAAENGMSSFSYLKIAKDCIGSYDSCLSDRHSCV